MTQQPEQPHHLVRFDFKPGATAKEIAEAIQAARKRVVAEYLEARAKLGERGEDHR